MANISVALKILLVSIITIILFVFGFWYLCKSDDQIMFTDVKRIIEKDSNYNEISSNKNRINEDGEKTQLQFKMIYRQIEAIQTTVDSTLKCNK